MEGRYRIWAGDSWREMPVPSLAGEALMLPAIAAVVSPVGDPDRLLLQRRDKPGEVVRGMLEVPTGRWRAGEEALAAIRREVAEETGVEVVDLLESHRLVETHEGRPFRVLEPALVVAGTGGAYPSLLVPLRCLGRGEPRPLPGETAEPRWVTRAEVVELVRTPTNFTGASFPIVARWAQTQTSTV